MDINQNPPAGMPLPPMAPKEGEMAKPAKKDVWKPLREAVKIPKKSEPQAPALKYSGNLREFSYGVKNELRHDLGKKLSVSQRAEVTKILSQRGGKFMGTRKERNELRQFAKEQGMPAWKARVLLKEAKNLRGKTRAA